MTEICGITPEALHIAVEDLAVTRQGIHAFLDARPARIVQADHRRAVLAGQVQQGGDFQPVRLTHRTAHDGEILGKDVDQPAVDLAPAGHHTVGIGVAFFHAETAGAVGDKHAGFLESAGVEQLLDPFTGGLFVLGMLGVDPRFAASQDGFGPDFFQWVGHFFHTVFSPQ